MRRKSVFLDDIRRIGLTGWLAYACNHAVSSASAGRIRFTALWFYAQSVEHIPTISGHASDRIQIRVIKHGEVPDEAFRRPPGAIAERFAQGSVCIAALKDSELVGFMWLEFDELRERLVRCNFIPYPRGKTCWDFDLFVSPQYRLGRTFGRLWSHAKSHLNARGVKMTLSWIAFENVASRRAHERMRAKRIGWALVLTAWKLQVVIASTKPFFIVGSGDKHRAQLKVDAK